MSQEEKDLATHVEICAIRYKAIEEKMDGLEQRITKVENSVTALKADIQSGFSSIALKIEQDSNRRTIQLIATAGSVIVAIVGALGVWLTHH
jgi:predicted  nucleic acid-binding Zn-ribbon protein